MTGLGVYSETYTTELSLRGTWLLYSTSFFMVECVTGFIIHAKIKAQSWRCWYYQQVIHSCQGDHSWSWRRPKRPKHWWRSASLSTLVWYKKDPSYNWRWETSCGCTSSPVINEKLSTVFKTWEDVFFLRAVSSSTCKLEYHMWWHGEVWRWSLVVVGQMHMSERFIGTICCIGMHDIECFFNRCFHELDMWEFF